MQSLMNNQRSIYNAGKRNYRMQILINIALVPILFLVWVCKNQPERKQIHTPVSLATKAPSILPTDLTGT